MKYYSSSSRWVAVLVLCTILAVQLLFVYVVFGCVILSNTTINSDWFQQQLQENELDIEQCTRLWGYNLLGVVSAAVLFVIICLVSISVTHRSRIIQGGLNGLQFAQPIEITIKKNVAVTLIISGLPLLAMCLSTLLVWGSVMQIQRVGKGESATPSVLPIGAQLSCSIKTSDTNTANGNGDINALFAMTFLGVIAVYGYTVCASIYLGVASWIDSSGSVL